MKPLRSSFLILVAATAATALHGAFAELNPVDGTIMSPDGTYSSREMTIAKDFKLEMLYVVPRAAQGSWVPMTWDNKGRLLVASHNTEQMFRLTVPRVGSPDPVKVETIDLRIGAAHGLLYAFDSLFVMVDEGTTRRNGIYRLTDTNNDDKFDQVRVVRVLQGSGQHGTHALELTPDGKRIMMVNGNDTYPSVYQSSAVPLIWNEDQLMPRMDDTGLGGHAAGRFAPGGWTASIDPEGTDLRLETMGYRNAVDFAFNKDGEMFVYDSDLEFDKGTSWYRPTRLTHAISGADQGWRHGSGKMPKYYIDTWGQVIGLGSGSPTGVTTGTGAKFPAKYQDALYLSDWSYGNLYSVNLSAEGSTYTGLSELFASGTPFGVADVKVNPADGSLLILVGGNNNSVLYRATYTGSESVAPSAPSSKGVALRNQRKELEKFHGTRNPQAVAAVWPFLKHEDRGIRFAARTALEWQDRNTWRDRALAETDPRTAIAALVALARVSGTDTEHRPNINGGAPDKALQARIIAALDKISWSELGYQDKLDLIRAYSIAFTRFGELDGTTAGLYPVRGKMKLPDEATRQRLIAKFDPLFPTGYRELNWEMGELLAYLEAPNAVSKMVALMRRAPAQQYFPIEEFINPQQRVRGTPGTEGGLSNAFLARQEDEMKYAELLRAVDTGWTPALRRDYLAWFQRAAREYQGGNSFRPYVSFIHTRFVAKLTDAEKAAIDDQSVLAPITAGGGRGGAAAGGPVAAPVAVPAGRAGTP
jgi:hypothetical protein